MREGIWGFLLGCVLTGGALGIYASGLKAELSAAQVDAQNQKMNAKVEQNGEESQEQTRLHEVTQQRDAMAQQRDACQGRFQRATFLYQNTLLGGPIRQWAIPADVEPVYLGAGGGTFTHYDQKTQMETVKFQAKQK